MRSSNLQTTMSKVQKSPPPLRPAPVVPASRPVLARGWFIKNPNG
jgi:hypothetical protein